MTSKNQTIAKERKARTTVRRLLLEGLQSRLLMAGDVSAVIDNGYLVVRGDDAANEITIQGIGGNQIQVTGATGTTINGLTQPAILRLRKGVDIDMKGGDDKLTVIGVNAFGRYQIRMELGAGNDTLVADGLFAQRIHANGGDGNDSITVRNSRSWKGSGVGGGAGDDTLVLQNLRYGNGSCIDGGTGKNTVTETNNRYGARFTKQNVDSSTVVDPPTTPPVANNDTATVVVGQSIAVGVLTNDTSSGNSLDPKTVAIATQPSSGTVAVNSATGVITYTHNGGAARTDSFTYTVKDNKGTISNSATVNITITETPKAPTAVADTISVANNASATVNLANNDTAGTAAINRNSIALGTQPVNGTVTVGTDGNVTYKHNGSSTTTDSFTYTIKDVNGLTSAAATVQVTIAAANLPAPTAVNDTASVTKSSTVTIPILTNDVPPTGGIDLASVTITAQPTQGTVSKNSDGSVVYTHSGGSATTDQFKYTVKGTNGSVSNEATVTLTITPPNQPPVANNDTATVDENGAVSIPILSNDTAPTGGMNLSSVNFTLQPTQGTLSKNSDGSVVYTHTGGAATSDQFRYTVQGTNGLVSNEATVAITIKPGNKAPVANNDSASVVEGGSVNIPVLSNDTDIDGNINVGSIVIVTQPSHGVVGIDKQTGIINYVHNGGPSTSDSFTYTVKDALGLVSNVASVSIAIQKLPVANDDAITLNRAEAATIDVTANDTAPSGTIDKSKVVIKTQPVYGTAMVLGNGQVRYQHDGTKSTSDSYTYTIKDSNGNESAPATVNVTIVIVNVPPTTTPDSATVLEGGTVDVSVLTNDIAPFDGIDTASLTVVTPPSHGTATVQSDGTIRYVHDGSETTSDFFEYTVRGNNGLVSSSARVNLNITPVNDPPVVQNDTATVDEGGTVNIPVLANDTDADNAIDAASLTIVDLPSRGTAVLGVGGVIVYTHDGSETTSDQFTYRVKDASGVPSNLGTVSITVNPVNDPPIASNDAASIKSNVQAIVDLAKNDFDPDDGLDLSGIQIGTQPAHGTLTIHSDGTVTYVHDGSEATADTFTYRIKDKSGALSNEATVALTIELVNQPPVAVADQATIASKGGQVVINLLANDFDPDGGLNEGSLVILQQPSHGNVLDLGDGSVRYTHNGSDNLEDSFTYKIRDFAGALSNEATVTIQVVPV